MPAAPPGTETLIISTGDGALLAVTLHFDPDTAAWADPAVTAEGTGGGVLYLTLAGGGTAALAVQAGVPIAAAVMAAVGSTGRGPAVLTPSAVATSL